MAQKPLMLKDYLELDSCSESFWWTPLHHTRAASIRSLLETELGGGAADEGRWKLVRLKSKSALTRLSTFIKLLQSPLPVSATGPPLFLPRNFSKKLIRSFRKKTGNDRKDGETVLCPSHVSSSNADVKESLPMSPRTEKGIVVIGGGEKSLRPPAGSREPEESGGKGDMDCPFEEEKEQCSPVSVMDFPYGEEDEDDAVVEQPSLNSSSFDQSVINIEKDKEVAERGRHGEESHGRTDQQGTWNNDKPLDLAEEKDGARKKWRSRRKDWGRRCSGERDSESDRKRKSWTVFSGSPIMSTSL